MDLTPKHGDLHDPFTDQYVIFHVDSPEVMAMGGKIAAIRAVRARDLLGLHEAKEYVEGLKKRSLPISSHHDNTSFDKETIDRLQKRMDDMIEDVVMTHRARFSSLLAALLQMKVKHPNQLKVEFGNLLVEAGYQSPFSNWYGD